MVAASFSHPKWTQTLQQHGSLNVPIEHHPTIRYMVYNGYYKVMSNIPKMGQLPTPEQLPNNTLASKSGSSSSISHSCSFRVKSPGGTWIKQAGLWEETGLLSDAGSMEKPQISSFINVYHHVHSFSLPQSFRGPIFRLQINSMGLLWYTIGFSYRVC